MKKLIIITLYFSVIFFNGMGYSLDTSSVKFMPLAIGNIWVYDYYTQGGVYQYSAVMRVTGDTISNSRRYYKCVGVVLGGMQLRGDTNTGSLMNLGAINSCYINETLVDSLAMQSGYYSCIGPCAAGLGSNQVVLGMNVPTFNRQTGFGHSYSVIRYAKYIGAYWSGEFLFNVLVRYYVLRGARINGVVYGDTSGITGISQINSEIPSEYSLSQNYPNPFNPVTKIKFDIPKISFTKLVIYDLLGREVATLVNEELKPGTYEADWNASAFSSGVYFYKIVAGDYTETKKMVLMK